MRILKSERGISFVAVLVIAAMLAISIFLVLSVINSAREQATILKIIGARDRIWSSIQTMALMPAALRNSARALSPNGIHAQNPQLRLCLNGDSPNSCQSGVESGLSLYSPVVFLDASGNPMGLQKITASPSGGEVVRYDTNGMPCQLENSGCFFKVTTVFVPTCGPAPMPAVLPANLFSPNIFAPLSTCTIADIVEIRFTVAIEETLSNQRAFSYLNGVSPKSGIAISAVKSATGNDPQ